MWPHTNCQSFLLLATTRRDLSQDLSSQTTGAMWGKTTFALGQAELISNDSSYHDATLACEHNTSATNQ